MSCSLTITQDRANYLGLQIENVMEEIKMNSREKIVFPWNLLRAVPKRFDFLPRWPLLLVRLS